MEVSLFSHEISNRTRRNGLKMHHRRFSLSTRINFFTERILNHWNRLLREVVEPPFLEVFEIRVYMALRDIVVDSAVSV